MQVHSFHFKRIEIGLIEGEKAMFAEFLVIILKIFISIGAWIVIEQIVKNFNKKNLKEASRFTTIIYDIYAICGGLILAIWEYFSIGIIFTNVNPIPSFYCAGLLGYLLYNISKPLTRKYPEVFFHHIFVGGILIIALVWGYPSVILPFWFLIELNELFAQIRYLSRNSKKAVLAIQMEYYIRVFNLCWVTLLAVAGHVVKWHSEAPILITGLYWLISYYLVGMYIYEVGNFRKRSQKWIKSKDNQTKIIQKV